MTRIVLVGLFAIILIGCGTGQKEAVVGGTATVGCPDLTPAEVEIRQLLQTRGLTAETVTLRVEGCQIVGWFSYEGANSFVEENPDVEDPSLLPSHPLRELREQGLDLKRIQMIPINWIDPVVPNQRVCTILASEGLRCE